MIHERQFSEGEFIREADDLAPIEQIKAYYLDQARFSGIRHNPFMRIKANTTGVGRHIWCFDDKPLFVIPTNGSRLLEVDLIEGGKTLGHEYIDHDVVVAVASTLPPPVPPVPEVVKA